jgi:hypothetical protein
MSFLLKFKQAKFMSENRQDPEKFKLTMTQFPQDNGGIAEA